MSERHPCWEARLSAYLDAVRRSPHVYGEFDCLLFSAGWVEAVRGIDLGTEHAGRYHHKRGARHYLRSLGFDTPASLIDSHLEARPVAFARRGDLVLADGVPGGCIGGEALFVGEAGLIRKPREHPWTWAWTV